MALTYSDDHQDRAAALLASQYQESQSVTGLVRDAVAEDQALEDLFWQEYTETVDTAEGAQLDVIGRIVGQPRNGCTDPVYRMWLRARMLVNRSSGTPEDIIACISAITPGNAIVRVQEVFPAGIVVSLSSSVAPDPDAASAILKAARAAGVDSRLESATSTDAAAFAFDPNGAGWGSASDPSIGGAWATVVV